jgi:hypothetical protein
MQAPRERDRENFILYPFFNVSNMSKAFTVEINCYSVMLQAEKSPYNPTPLHSTVGGGGGFSTALKICLIKT